MTCGYLYKNECYNEAPWLLFRCVCHLGLGIGLNPGVGGGGCACGDNTVHVLTKVFPPSYLGEFCFWIDGLGCWALEFFTFFSFTTQEYMLNKIQTLQKETKQFPVHLPTHTSPTHPAVTIVNHLVYVLSAPLLCVCLHIYVHTWLC